MEVYAGYSENADHNVGRVIEAIEELGELDNTLVIWIWGDNGASMEGRLTDRRARRQRRRGEGDDQLVEGEPDEDAADHDGRSSRGMR